MSQRPTHHRLLVAALAAALLSGVHACIGDELTPQTVRVELDVFSGRPNPAWELTATQTHEMLRVLAALAQATPRVELPQGLGYRGFKVSGVEALVVYRDHVTGESMQWVDPDRSVEAFLLKTAEAHVDASVLQSIRDGS